MKKIYIIVRVCLFLSLITIFVYFISFFRIYLQEKREKIQIEELVQAKEEKLSIQGNNNTNKMKYKYKVLSKEKKQVNKFVENPLNMESWKGDCIISIPYIDLHKIVYTGENRKYHLNNYELITATDDMQFQNGGNYIVCGHASRLYGHSLNRIRELKIGNNIYINDKYNNQYQFKVKDIRYIDMMNSKEYSNQTNENILTIISCAKYISDKSYIVIHAAQVTK